jgi:hypothetical protein
MTARKTRILSLVRSLSFPSPWKRAFHISQRLSSLLVLATEPSRSISKKREELVEVLAMDDPNPSRVWNRYRDALLFFSQEEIPLEIHQAVLRKCTSPTAELRVAALRRIVAQNMPKTPHIRETRFRIIIRCIRSAGWKPSLDDYNFILEQFAAVGHHIGSMQVYRELSSIGIKPRTKTFGLCLQAIAHRLTLPCKDHQRPFLVQATTKMLNELMVGMRTHEIPFTSVNLDLAIRILKETSDEQSFECLLRIGYGIDMSYLDRPPIDRVNAPQPFSTAALNTTIDMLGRLGNISKLVQAFEVFTQPLPPEASQHFASSFEDDEDLDFGMSIISPSAQTYAHAAPNTTTYNLLLKHVSRAGHAVFARHYLRQALYLERLTDRQLRGEIIKGTPLAHIRAPHFAINRGTVLSVFGQANRDKNIELMKRVLVYMRRSMRRKKENIYFYANVIKHDVTISVGETTSTTSLTTMASSQTQTRDEKAPNLSVFDVDLDAPPTLPPPPVKYFNIKLHLSLLQRDLDEMLFFYKHACNVLARSVQRVKERLGRRVWNGKNIWLLTDKEGERRGVSRTQWTKVVRFRSVKTIHPPDALGNASGTSPRTHSPPGAIADHQGFSI